MTDTALVPRDEPTLTPFEVIERVISQGDLAKMAPEDRIAFYWRTCESLGLNPLTRPFEFIVLNGKMTMYARKDATDQLRRINGVSVTDIRRETDEALGLITVYANVRDSKGRTDEASGIVSTKGLSGEALANAVMKAETKAKRRATLSLVGLGFLDESEVEDRGEVEVDPTTGVITARPVPQTLLERVKVQQEALEGKTEYADEPRQPEAPTSDAEATLAAVEPEVDPVLTDEVVADPGASAGVPVLMTKDAFLAGLQQHRIAPAFAAARAREMFPFSTGGLTDEQRGELFTDLVSP